MNTHLLAGTVLLGLAASPAMAQWPKAVDARLTREYNRCQNSGDAARGVTPAMNACYTQEIDRQDARLNQAYVMVMKRLPARRKAALRASERAWIGKRNAECKAAADSYDGGTGASLEYNGCYLRHTIERTLWLEKYR